VVLRKPFGPTLRDADGQVEQLQDKGWRIEIINTSPDYDETEEKYLQTVEPGDATLVIGGDGSGNRAYRMNRQLDAREHPILPIGGGNACDWRWMLTGDSRAADVLSQGRFTAAYALEMHIENDGRAKLVHGLGYVGIGATGQASFDIDATKNTSNTLTRKIGFQQAREAVAAWMAVGTFKRFILTPDSEDRQYELSDVSAFKGDRVAKYGQTHADLLSPEYELLSSSPLWLPGALTDMVQLKQGKKVGTMMRGYIGFTIETPGGGPLPGHGDGETILVESGSHCTLSTSDPYYTWVTRYAA
jgi:hypothetical protein